MIVLKFKHMFFLYSYISIIKNILGLNSEKKQCKSFHNLQRKIINLIKSHRFIHKFDYTTNLAQPI